MFYISLCVLYLHSHNYMSNEREYFSLSNDIINAIIKVS